MIRATIKPSKRNWNLIIRQLREAPPEDGPVIAKWLSPLLEHWPDSSREPHKDVAKLLMAGSPLPSASLWRGSLNLDSKKGVSSLQGLQNAIGLTEISLWQTSVVDLSPLKSLNRLEHLSFPQTQIKDLSPLKGLRSLLSITAWNSEVSDLTPLAGLSKLEKLQVARTPSGDLTPIKNLVSLRELSTGKNFNDFSQLSMFHELEILRTSHVGDTSLLTHLVKLRELNIKLRNIDLLANFPDLEGLNLSYSREVTDFGVLSPLTKINQLYLAATEFDDLEIITGMSSLKILDLRDTFVSDLTPIRALQSLERLDLSHTGVENLAPLAELANLRVLTVCSDLDLGPIEVAIANGLRVYSKKRREI